MLQRGQLFEVHSTIPDDKTLWAFRYLVGGCDSKRVQRGAFATERDAGEALERALERLRRDGRAQDRSRSLNWSSFASRE